MIRFFDTSRFCKKEEVQGEIPKFFKISKDVMKIVWASMLESFLVALVTMFDSIQVAKIGDNNANAAITICKQPYFIMVCLANALNIVLTAVVARRKGEKDIENANKTMHMGFVLAIILSIFLTVSYIFLSKPLCLLMGAEEGITLEYSVDYLRIMSGGFIFNALALCLNGCQKGIGNTKISLISNLCANAVNVFLNFCLITGKCGLPALGIKGAALASIIGQFVAFIIALISVMLQKDYVKFRFSRIFKWNKETLKPVFQLLPSVLVEQILMRIGFMLFNIIVGKLGADDIFIQGTCMDINSMLFTLSDGFAIGTAAIIGHRLGEKRKDLAIVYAKVSMMLSVTCGIIICIVMILLRKYIINLYHPDSTYKFDTIYYCLLIAAAACVFQNIQWVITGVLRSAGDSKFTATTSLLSVAIIRPLTAYLFIFVFFKHTNSSNELVQGLGVYGAWISQFIDQALRMTLNIFRFKSRKWINIKL